MRRTVTAGRNFREGGGGSGLWGPCTERNTGITTISPSGIANLKGTQREPSGNKHECTLVEV